MDKKAAVVDNELEQDQVDVDEGDSPMLYALARMCECDERARWWKARADEHQRRLFQLLAST